MTSYEFRDRTIMVTGAGGRLGSALVAELWRAGADVIAVDRAEAGVRWSAERAGIRGSRLHVFEADLGEVGDTESVFAQSVIVPGRLDGLVCAHGIFPNTPIREMKMEAWDRVLNVNARSVMLLTKLAFAYWTAEEKPGGIVHITSIAGHSARAGAAHYGASKAAAEMLTQVAAIEGGPLGIRVNAVAPGLVLDEVLEEDTNDLPEYFAKALAATPLRRTGSALEVARACMFLLSDDASFITGVTLDVGGGAHVGRPQMPFTGDLQ